MSRMVGMGANKKAPKNNDNEVRKIKLELEKNKKELEELKTENEAFKKELEELKETNK